MLNKSRGFTLIEMMVVVVIIGIVIAIAVVSMNMINDNRRAKMVAAQMHQVILTAKSRAVLMPETIGLKIDRQGYQFYGFILDNKGHKHWVVLRNDALSHPYAFLHGILAHLKGKHHYIIFSQSGDVTPFTLLISDLKHSETYQLKMNKEDVLTLKNITAEVR